MVPEPQGPAGGAQATVRTADGSRSAKLAQRAASRRSMTTASVARDSIARWWEYKRRTEKPMVQTPRLGAEHGTSTRGGVSPAGRTAIVAGAVIAPVIFVLTEAFFPVLPNTIEEAFSIMAEQRELIFAKRILSGVSSALFVLLAGPIGFLVPLATRGALLTRIGLLLMSAGAILNALSQIVQGYATHAATRTGIPVSAGQDIVLTIVSGPEGVLLGFWVLIMFALGLIVTGVGLLLSRRVGTFVPILLMAGSVVALALSELGPIVVVTMAPFAIALIVVVITAARSGYLNPLSERTK